MGNTSIQWTDETWNPVRGCDKVSAGCKNCYAETFANRWKGTPGHAYEQGFKLRLVPEKLDEPLSWRKPRRVFVNSMSDLFHDGVPAPFIESVFRTMAQASRHTFQVLTKRAERMREVVCGLPSELQNLPNVWLGVSVENQEEADRRIPHLLRVPAKVRFLSCEPLLGPIRFDRAHVVSSVLVALVLKYAWHIRELDWVIVGGESGPRARPCSVEWIREIVAQCKGAEVPVFVKQLGSDARDAGTNGAGGWPMGYLSVEDKKGGDPDEWPGDLRVREFPEVSR